MHQWDEKILSFNVPRHSYRPSIVKFDNLKLNGRGKFQTVLIEKVNYTNSVFLMVMLSEHNVILPPSDLDAPGEMGKPVVLPTNMTAEVKKLVDEGWLNNAFNQYASDLISVHRSLPDPRDDW